MKPNFLFKKVLENKKVKGLLDENYFLGSVFCMPKVNEKKKISIEKWIFHFYNPKNEKVVSVDISDNGSSINVSEPEKAVKPMKELNTDDFNKYKSPKKYIEKYVKEIKIGVSNIMVTLHEKEIPKKKENVVWSIVLILKSLNAYTYDIDAKTGKKINEEKDSLVRRVSKAS